MDPLSQDIRDGASYAICAALFSIIVGIFTGGTAGAVAEGTLTKFGEIMGIPSPAGVAQDVIKYYNTTKEIEKVYRAGAIG